MAERAISSTMDVMNIEVVKIAPTGSVSALRGTTCGGAMFAGMRERKMSIRAGYSATAAATVGRAVHAENVRKDMWNDDVSTRFVGFELTSSADARLAPWNSAKRNAVGGSMRACEVKYATNGVPDSTIGSLPTARASTMNRRYRYVNSDLPFGGERDETVSAR